MKRTRLCDRVLPTYSQGEEILNMVTHIAGGGLGLLGAIVCMIKALGSGSTTALLCAIIYGITITAVFTMSSIYHGLKPGTAKKVMQVADHCTIYFLIAGTYTPIVLCALAPKYPIIGWGLFIFQWGLAILAAVLTAIDLKSFRVFSMICYIGMGWSIVFFLPQTVAVLSPAGFGFLLAGGVAYTIGAILFGLGRRLKWMHSAFHVFVILGCMLQLAAVAIYVL